MIILKKRNNAYKKIKLLFFKISVDFRRRILWRVTVVLEKESWGIRISLNTTISIQVFNVILLISPCLYSEERNTIFFKNILLNVILGEGTQTTNDGFFDELQLSSNKNLEVRLVVLSIIIIDSCQYF